MSKRSSNSGEKHTPMTPEAAARIQSAAARHPDSPSAESDFAPRAQSAAARNEDDDQGDE